MTDLYVLQPEQGPFKYKTWIISSRHLKIKLKMNVKIVKTVVSTFLVNHMALQIALHVYEEICLSKETFHIRAMKNKNQNERKKIFVFNLDAHIGLRKMNKNIRGH